MKPLKRGAHKSDTNVFEYESSSQYLLKAKLPNIGVDYEKIGYNVPAN
jgi:hypothetical protein